MTQVESLPIPSGRHAPGRPRSFPLAHPERALMLPYVALRDVLRTPKPETLTIEAIEAAAQVGVEWLCLTHDVTERNGCAKGFSYLSGWMPQFPETTGYIIGTLLAWAQVSGDRSLVERAFEMGEWEIDVQNPDGGVVVGLLQSTPKPSTVFNTGMVMHGWLDLFELSGDKRYLEAALRGGEYLVRCQDGDGAWRGACEYRGVPHTYSSRVSWALVRLADTVDDDRFRASARAQLDWVLRMQQDNGWLDACAFEPKLDPNTHLLAYTMRGLLESSLLLGHDPYLAAACRTADALLDLFTALGRLPATFNRRWEPTAPHLCLTGIAQVAGIWLRLYQVTGEERYLDAGSAATELAVAHQARGPWRPVRGALPGSYPIFGRYSTLQYPNWATKFLIDTLLLRRELLLSREKAPVGAA